MRILKRSLSLLLILLIVISCMPLRAFAEEENQEAIAEETAANTTVESETTSPPETIIQNETTEMNPADNDPEVPTSEATITKSKEEVTSTDSSDNTPEETPSEETNILDGSFEVEDTSVPESDASLNEETDNTPEESADNMLLATEPTRGSAYLRMINMDQYSYSFDSSFPEPFKNRSRNRTVQFWFGDTPAYCLQFGKEAESGMAYSTVDFWDGISETDRRLLAWILRFGYVGWCRYGASTSQEYMATQVLIWQVLSHTVNTSWEQAICDEMMGSGSRAQEVYWKIKANVYAADIIPSFCSESDNSSTPVYDLEKLPEGGYSVKLTDTNDVLSRFDFSRDGVSVSRDGNILTVTIAEPVEGLTLSADKDFSDWTSGNALFWKPGNPDGYQYMGSFDTGKASEEVRAVFRVTSPIGHLTIKKASTNPQCTDGNAMYSLEGTTFEVRDSDGNLVGTLVSDKNGRVDPLEIPAGQYTVTETKVGLGYIRDTSVKTVTVRPGETAEVVFSNEPVKDPVSIYLRKWDADADTFIPQGKGTFAGAQYRIDYYDNTEWSGTPTASWTFKTDDNGILRYLPPYLVSGPALYTFNGAYLFPLGSIKITEVKAPTGYLLSTDTLYARILQNGNVGRIEWTTETQGIIKAIPEGYGMLESVIRGGVRFKKTDIETGAAISGAEISIYNNSGADVLIGGVSFANGEKITTLTTDEIGICETTSDYLPFGTYYAVEENSPIGYLLNEGWRADFSITENGKIVDLTTGSNLLKDQAIHGGVRFKKVDVETGKPVSGAQISIYNNSDSEVFVDGSLFAKGALITTLTTGDNGICETTAFYLPYGSYYAKETKSSEGYLLNEDWTVYFRITENGEIVDLVSEGNLLKEQIIRGGVRFKKTDKETGIPVSGADISIYNNCDGDILVDGTVYSKGDLITTLTTEADGICETPNDYLPYGFYYALETKPSEGYLLNEEWRADFSITENGKIVDLTDSGNVLKEQIIRGDLLMLKLDIDGNYKPNIPFMIVQIGEDGVEGEWHVIVTDANGMIDTSAASRPHTNNTNSLDLYVDGGVFTDTSKLDPTVGVWFGESQPDDSLGALPYGRYKIYELQTEQLAAEQINILESMIIEIRESNQTVILAPMVNLNIDLTSEAASAAGQNFIPAAAVRVVDTVHYTNLTSHRRYTMETQFVLKSTSEVLATVSADFYPPEGPAETNTAKGSVSLEAEIDVSAHPGDFVVACDYLYEYVKGTKILIASHADLEDKTQTLKIPSICTAARDGRTGGNVGTVSENARIIDTVSYTNLKRGEVFMLVSKLGDSETGETIKDADGEDLTVEKRFVCWKEADSVDMPAFGIDSTQYAGKSVVVLEELYWIDEEHDNVEVLMASHASYDDKEQTITYPDVHTSATDAATESLVGTVSGDSVVKDKVQLIGLITGKEYTVSGKLVYQEEFVDQDHKLHRAGDAVPIKDGSETSITFTADAEEMTVTLTYIVDSTVLEGHTAVVYEDLIHNGVTVATHADLDDKEQTVWFPSLKTRAIDKTSDTSFVTKGTEVIFIDTVNCGNLVPGETYIIRGRLMDKESGSELGYISQSEVFTASQKDVTVTVEFTVNTEKLGSGIIVVFEDLYLVKEDESEILVVKHEDLNDEKQFLYNPEIGTTAVNAETGTHETQGKSKTVLMDTVSYRNLKVGEEYTIVGTLMDKATGNPIIINGERVTSRATFVSTEKDGKITVLFEFDATDLVGKTTVVFESLLHEGIEIAVHADIEDEEQSVNIIDIRTSAVDAESASHEATWSHTATVIDTVSYTGLTAGKTYTVYGTVIVKGTGDVLYQNGIPITGMTEFVPDEPDGTVEVSFVVDTYTLQGMEIVVFERLFAGSVTGSTLESDAPIAAHEDINDKDQTINVPMIPFTPPDTGVNDHMGLLMATMLTSGAGAIWIFCRRKRH